MNVNVILKILFISLKCWLNVFNIFKELSIQQGLSLLIVTHDQDFANKTDRIIEMGDGRIIS